MSIVFDKQPIWSDAESFEVRHSRPSPPYFTWKTIRASISPCALHTYAITPIIGLDIIKFRRRPCSVHTVLLLCALIIPCIPVFPIVWRGEYFRPAGNLFSFFCWSLPFPFYFFSFYLLIPREIKGIGWKRGIGIGELSWWMFLINQMKTRVSLRFIKIVIRFQNRSS